MEEAIKLLGLGQPFIYATGVYALFFYLDKEASTAAKRAITNWLRPVSHNNEAIAGAMVEVFDKLYTRPLFGWRAFIRSSIITVVLTGIFAFQFFPAYSKWIFSPRETHFWIFQVLCSNIVSDYISLFIVRRWLITAGRWPLLALFASPLIGVAIILSCLYLIGTVFLVIFDRTLLLPDQFALAVISILIDESVFGPEKLGRELFIPALFVSLWLPLFALGVVFIKGFNGFVWAAGVTQWFLKKGKSHPLQAVGYVAGVIVFLSTSALTLLKT